MFNIDFIMKDTNKKSILRGERSTIIVENLIFFLFQKDNLTILPLLLYNK